MTEVPKIVYDRLRAAELKQSLPEGAPGQVHPDADLLAAFAEQGLSATERDGVLEHLALCGDCREVIAVALPAAEIGPASVANETDVQATPIEANRRTWLTVPRLGWPSLRWGALAAGVVVVASVLTLRPGRLNSPPTPPSHEPHAALTAPPVPSPERDSRSLASSSKEQSSILGKASQARPRPMPPPPTQLASNTGSPAPSPQVVSPSVALSMNQSRIPGKADNARLKSESQLSKEQTGGAERSSLEAKSETVIADNKKDSTLANRPATLPEGANEVVEVSGAQVAVETEQPSARGSLMARSEAPPIAKAKQPPQTETSQLQDTISAPGHELPLQGRNVTAIAVSAAPSSFGMDAVTFAITAGVLKRSPDSGQSWKEVVRADHPLLCYASQNADVWTGGEAGTLLHSVDKGATWLQVHPSFRGSALSSDVTHIDIRDHVRGDVRGPVEVVISTNNNETWSSADGGKTWEKK